MKKNLVLLNLLLVMLLAALTTSHSLAYSSIGSTPLPKPSIIEPLDILKSDLFKNIVPNIGIGTTIPNLNLLNTKNLSGGDLVSVLRAIAVLAINLFLIVIQTVAGILKALLPFLS